jgi:hypothetical protein
MTIQAWLKERNPSSLGTVRHPKHRQHLYRSKHFFHRMYYMAHQSMRGYFECHFCSDKKSIGAADKPLFRRLYPGS